MQISEVYIKFEFVGSSQPEKVLLLYVSKSTSVLDHLSSGLVCKEPLCLHPREPDLKVLSKYRQHEVHNEVQQNMTRVGV